MTILELREKRNKAWEAAKAFVETKRDNDGLLSAEDAATYAEIEQKVQNYSAEIARMEEMEAMETELNKPVNTPITGKPMNSGKAPEKKNPRLSILGILLTKVDRRTNFARDISDAFCGAQRTPMRFRADVVRNITDALKHLLL